MIRYLSLALSFSLLTAGPVLGQSKADPKSSKSSSVTHRFSGLHLKGQLKKPELSYIYKRTGLRSEKIVTIPENFNDDIIQDGRKF